MTALNGRSRSYRLLRQAPLPLRPEACLGTNLQVKFPSRGFPKDISPRSTSPGPSLPLLQFFAFCILKGSI